MTTEIVRVRTRVRVGFAANNFGFGVVTPYGVSMTNVSVYRYTTRPKGVKSGSGFGVGFGFCDGLQGYRVGERQCS